MRARPDGPVALADALAQRAYLADRGLATALHLAGRLGRPLLLEGDAGVGKTEAAKAVADVFGATLVRLQCHEGIDRSQALYAWDHPRQLLHLRALEASGERPDAHEQSLYTRRFLLARPLLTALELGRDAVLLVDEVDRADDEFEAFLLEVLSDFQVTVPELGTIRAPQPPTVILTSNRTRELSEALRRRCLYHWIDHPDVEREAAIVRVRVPEVPDALAHRIAGVVARLRALDLHKPPGVAETVDWARVTADLGGELDVASAADTLGVVIKDRDDLTAVRRVLAEVVEASR
ncbi:AAA family ATPase [Egicoccus halophilus]|uniref:MoxR-like ATPase n=1 Tax=Egicoccus halophilus TaxID=1670830 RepID=A0A8J3EZE3_9ACTN|nr:MoxR family ATPase [Egicoccus halophilus]GGI09800.1 MoxR-like ATPase [Egicoccus halophilus]